MARALKGMVVVITGASAGIGKELALQLGRAGAKLVLAARRLDRLQDTARSCGTEHLCIAADVSSADDCRRIIEGTHARFGRIDTLVCNAGYGLVRPIVLTSEREMEAIFRTNVFGTTDCIRAAVPIMERQAIEAGYRGQVVIVSSAAGRRGLPYYGAYSATKAAQLSIAEALRVELEPVKIAVTSIHPIGTETDFFTSAQALSGRKADNPTRKALRQSARTVARAIARSIIRPCPEVWPMPPARLALSLVTLFPRLGDAVMIRMRREMDA